MRQSVPSLLRAMIEGIGIAGLPVFNMPAHAPQRTPGQSGMRDIIGPASGWPGAGTPSRRDRRRADALRLTAHLRTVPDLTRQIEREAKQARGRKARARPERR